MTTEEHATHSALMHAREITAGMPAECCHSFGVVGGCQYCGWTHIEVALGLLATGYDAVAAELDRLREALIECAVPLEALAMAVVSEVAPEIMQHIREKALPLARAAITHKETQ